MDLSTAIKEAKDLIQCMEIPTPDQIKAIEKLVEYAAEAEKRYAQAMADYDYIRNQNINMRTIGYPLP